MAKERLFVLLGFTALAIIAYRNCFGIFIPGDNYSLFYLFEKGGIQEAINNIGPLYFSIPLLFFTYKLIGVSPFLWVMLSLLLHIANSFFVYLLAEKSTSALIGKKMNSAAIFAGLLFLVSPYQTETILWIPTNLTISIATFLCLVCLLLLLDYLRSGQRSTLFFLLIMFALSVFSYESAFVLPVISLLVFILYKAHCTTGVSLQQFAIRLLLPQTGILLLYLSISKMLFGAWLWHGENFELSFSIMALAGNFLKYLAKFFLLYRYLPVDSLDGYLRQAFSTHSNWILLFTLIGFIFLISFAVFILKTKNVQGKFLLLLFLCFAVSLLPVLSLDSSFLKNIYPDRYGYLPSVFFFLFFVYAVFFLLKKFSVPVLIGYFALSLVLLSKTNDVWSSDNEYCGQLTQNYKPFLPYDRVYILNVPTYYKGVAAFRSAFAETIFMRYDASPIEKIRVISGCYQESGADSLASVSIAGNTVTVTGQKKNTPFFSTNGGWAKSYETEEYKVSFNPDGCSYTLVFKGDIPKNSAFICTSQSAWKKAL